MTNACQNNKKIAAETIFGPIYLLACVFESSYIFSGIYSAIEDSQLHKIFSLILCSFIFDFSTIWEIMMDKDTVFAMVVNKLY